MDAVVNLGAITAAVEATEVAAAGGKDGDEEGDAVALERLISRFDFKPKTNDTRSNWPRIQRSQGFVRGQRCGSVYDYNTRYEKAD